jgi:hypothetical protein
VIDEPLDLSPGQIFAAASANCYIYRGWSRLAKPRLLHANVLPPIRIRPGRFILSAPSAQIINIRTSAKLFVCCLFASERTKQQQIRNDARLSALGDDPRPYPKFVRRRAHRPVAQVLCGLMDPYPSASPLASQRPQIRLRKRI